jgi:hypothetical protein
MATVKPGAFLGIGWPRTLALQYINHSARHRASLQVLYQKHVLSMRPPPILVYHIVRSSGATPHETLHVTHKS